MVITALLSTSGAVNASLYPSVGMTQHLASVGQFPPVFGRSVGRWRVPVGLLVMAGLGAVMVLAFNLNSIASLGSAVALLVFSAVTLAHFKVYKQTGAKLFVLVATLGTFVVFCTTTLVNEPATALALLVILALAVLVDLLWKRSRTAGDSTAEA